MSLSTKLAYLRKFGIVAKPATSLDGEVTDKLELTQDAVDAYGNVWPRGSRFARYWSAGYNADWWGTTIEISFALGTSSKATLFVSRTKTEQAEWQERVSRGGW